jgi:hypothetical protein
LKALIKKPITIGETNPAEQAAKLSAKEALESRSSKYQIYEH